DMMENLERSLSSLDIISRHVDKSHNRISQYLLKQTWGQQDRQCLLECLAQLLLEKDYTLLIAQHLRPLILDLLERSAERVKAGGSINHDLHERLCVALSKLLHICPDAHLFAARYFSSSPPVFQRLFFTSEQSSAVHYGPKRMKLRDLMAATLRFLQCDCARFRMLWDWSPCVSQLLVCDAVVRGYTAQCLAIIAHMTDHQKTNFLKKVLTNNEVMLIRTKSLKESEQMETEKALVLANQSDVMWCQDDGHKLNRGQVFPEDLSPNVVAVCGVVLPRTVPRQPEQVFILNLVLVDSTCHNLRSLALAVASQNPVLLEGPIGCGKTALVAYMAAITGHTKATQFLKVQLGDQTDSKMLLGMYRCTDIPGTFVWQPGTLTQAVSRGQWILLEDIDNAPLDVISVLLPLMENKKLVIPGREDCFDVTPGFQIFATRRVYYSGSSWHRPLNSHAALLDKYWTKIHMSDMNRGELKKVLDSRFPMLTVVSDRLLDIYCQLIGVRQSELDTGTLENPDDSPQDNCENPSSLLEGRDLSLRDLLKWCERISVNFDSTSSAKGQHIFQEALDCFTAMLSCPGSRLRMSEIIGSKLNISKEKAQYFCQMYQPAMVMTETQVSVGRASLDRKQAEAVQLVVNKQTFAATRPSAVLLEQLAVCVAKGEPVLLVGETGTGKTSTVQQLATVTGHKLRVMNMNQQSDTADLLGGYKPVDRKQILLPLREAFEDLFCQTYSRKQNLTFLGHMQTCFQGKRWQDLLRLMDHVCKSALANKLQKKPNEPVRQRWSQAVKKGHWILLDEINLAAAETLECLSGLLEGRAGSLMLLDRGDIEPLVRHPDFRLFACMNPATDVGKRNLPLGLRNRFTELYVQELENEGDLRILVSDYLKCLNPQRSVISGIIRFYLTARKETNSHLMDGTGHRPHYSLRTLCRALKYAAGDPCHNVQRSLYEGFCLSFLTQLDRRSHPLVQNLVCKHILMGNTMCLKQPIPAPPGWSCVEMEGYWIPQGGMEPYLDPSYILTASVKLNLRDLARVVSAGIHPVLIQGETSVGKTSLICWLAAASGNQCVRINNHEHTDIQEYIGCYSSDDRGKLVFKEGVLIDAMRKGYWIILDELNLAPTDVLEALNRLLDDNRELFVTETQEVIKAHPRFMLFATQNPPGLYGGRKVLSRAFRNRFVELHFDELPSGELETILHQRCNLPSSYCTKLVKVMLDLQSLRKGSSVFAGKHGFITLRDLFRWAERYRLEEQTEASHDWLQHLADDGYMLLAGRVRKPEEEATILTILEKHFKRSVNPDKLFSQKQVITQFIPEEFSHVIWTHGMRRLAVLFGRALRFGESVLLVGDTGCGKTTICQLFAALAGKKFFSVNCHLHMETSDFLGGLRPVRHLCQTDKDAKLFEWHDGPLVLAMKEGGVFLMDEISLADDSVLERLNSVLETEKSLVLAEKGSEDDDLELIRAATGFNLVATMNPGGDFGKKELSPALRNRFTEVWCPQSNRRSDLVQIIQHNLRSGLSLDGGDIADLMLDFIEWLIQQDFGQRCILSVRDILSWVNFLNAVSEAEWDLKLDTITAFVHAACLVYIDGIGSGTTASCADKALSARQMCLAFLQQRLSKVTSLDQELMETLRVYDSSLAREPQWGRDFFGINPFYIALGMNLIYNFNYAFSAGTTAMNFQRLLRALKLQRPVLLEGSPGVGKTSLVAALAKASGNHLVRINLSEQTDVSDLFGTDLPVEGGKGGEFAWRDGPLLAALKAGHWVVLDELNLASQSVLEGLNACFDHRAEIYIPELGMSFHVQHEKTKIFGCQNPFTQGGGRKGLPKSFLNRFTQVFVDQLTIKDMEYIVDSVFPSIDKKIITKMVAFSSRLVREVCVERQWGQKGSPWEFNLRDLFRWCQLMQNDQSSGFFNPGQHVALVYADRMRTEADKKFPGHSSQCAGLSEHSNHFLSALGVGFSVLHRSGGAPVALDPPLSITHQCLQPLESLMKCVEMGWMTILVGPTASGKTSLVRLLALLTGHRLRVMGMNSAMDTMELLGGFEQLDIMRPWQQVLESVDNIVAMVTRSGLMSLDVGIQDTEFLLQTWGVFSQWLREKGLQETGVTVNSEALDKLEVIILLLQKLNTKLKVFTDLSKLQMDFMLLKERLAQLKDGQTNGAFEWLDSMLVQALQDGDWLLMDNVNFCSSSVLDRLNALLEPNGSLTISERGVIDGETPQISPHPNFRLFLTMNPVHGELSRAMRNRGIEIYIPGEHEGACWDTLDLKTLLHTAGVTGDCVCDLLIEIHKDIKSAFWDSPASSLASLLHVAALLSCQLQRGVDLASALQHACVEAYSSCQRTTANQKVSKLEFQSRLSILDTEDWGNGLLCAGVWPDGFPSALLSTEDSCFSSVLRDGQVLLFCLNSLCLNRPLILKDLQRALQSSGAYEDLVFCGAVLNPEEGDPLRLIPTAVRLVTERASHGDWILRSSWLSHLGKSHKYAPAVDISQLPHPVLMHLLTFFNLWDAFVLKSVQTEEPPISDPILFELLQQLQWLDRFWNVSSTLPADAQGVSVLSLHWQWVQKHVILLKYHCLQLTCTSQRFTSLPQLKTVADCASRLRLLSGALDVSNVWQVRSLGLVRLQRAALSLEIKEYLLEAWGLVLLANNQPDPQSTELSLVWCELLSETLTALWTSSVTSHPDYWLRWDPVSPEKQPDPKHHTGSDTMVGPALLSKAVWSHCMLGVLSSSVTSGWEPRGVSLCSLSHGSLGEWKERIQQLQEVSGVLWENMAIPALAEFRVSDLRLQGAVLVRQLQSLTNLLPLSLQESYMKNCKALVEATNPVCAAQEIQMVLRDLLAPDLLPDGLVEVFSTCLQQYIQGKCQDSKPLAGSGLFWVNMGMVQIQLWTPQTIFDPAVKRAYKLNYAQQELALLKDEWKARSLSSQLKTGEEYLWVRIQQVKEQIDALSRKQAYRPHEPQYDQLFQDLQHYLCSIGQMSAIQELLSRLLTVLQDSSQSFKSKSAVQALLKEEAVWQNSQQRFCQKLVENYSLYPDVFNPIRTGILQLQHGMRLVASQLATSLTPVPDLPKLVSCLLAYPSVSPSFPSDLTRADFLCSRACMDVLHRLLELLPQQGPDCIILHSSALLMNSLLYVQCHVLSVGEFGPEAYSLFRHICQGLVNEWDEQERQKREQEQLEASVFRSRSQMHGSGLTEDEQEEKEFRLQFPQFNMDFADIQPQTNLVSPADAQIKRDDSVLQEAAEVGCLSQSAMNTLVQVHQRMCLGYARSLWYQSTAPANQIQEHIQALFHHTSISYLDSELDQQLTGSGLLLSAVLQNMVQGSRGPDELVIASEEPYNFYQHPNISEARLCLPVLEQLIEAVKQRLEDWPEHPALIQLTNVIEWILAFSLDSPLAKFLNGLEILLSKAQDWENNASRSVSLQKELQLVTQMIIQWRKLELNCWSNSLDNAIKRHTEKSTKHWFSIYQMIEKYLQEERETANIVSSTLQAFMEGSTVGEFHTRLRMLLSFHCHLLLVPNQPGRDFLCSLLWNLHKYYSQFSESVQAKVTQLRQPIEKELKDFIKISKWNDVSFWSVKQSNEGPEEGVEVSSLQARLPVLSRKMKEVCIQVLKQNPVPELAEDLDYFTCKIISNLKELQSLTVDTTADKEKQKTEFKHIQQQKQRALSDLFKMLSEMGLSYRKGLLWNRTADPETPLCLQPLEMTTAFSAVKNQELLKTIWHGCQKYFYRSWARKTAMQTALQHSTKELSVGTIERCRGFTAHLFKLLLKQRSWLAKLTDQWFSLRLQTSNIQDIKADLQTPGKVLGCILPPQDPLQDWVRRVQVLAAQCFTLLQQLFWLLQACPEEDQQRMEASTCSQNLLRCLSPLDPQYQPFGCLLRRGGIAWSQLHQQVAAMLKHTQKLHFVCFVFCRSSFDACCSAANQLAALADQMCSIEQLFTVSVGGTNNQPAITLSLRYVQGQVEAYVTEFTIWKTQLLCLGPQPPGECTQGSYTVLESLEKSGILILHVWIKGAEEKEDSLLKPSHLTQLVEVELEGDLMTLSVGDVSDGIKRLLSRLRSHRDSCQTLEMEGVNRACRMLVRVEPLLWIYLDLVRYYLAVSLGVHRSTGKLLSVLASIFTELAQKGFCLPQELMTAGDGATEFHDFENGGIGEGDGTKDVSDKIESEDQVEDTFQEGQVNEDDQDKGNVKPEDDAIEMSEDFNGQMHDGDENESCEEDEEDLDKKMGDLGQGQTDVLDERMWGDDDEEAGSEEESGQGMDQREFDENEVDPYHGEQEKRPEPEAMDLPQDLNLDQDEEAGDVEESSDGGENNNEDDEQPNSAERRDHNTDGQTGEENIQCDTAVEMAGEASERDDFKEEHGSGAADASQSEGHQSNFQSHHSSFYYMFQSFKRKPGQADNERLTGDYNERINKRLRTVDNCKEHKENKQCEAQLESELFEHIIQQETAYDTQTYGQYSFDTKHSVKMYILKVRPVQKNGEIEMKSQGEEEEEKRFKDQQQAREEEQQERSTEPTIHTDPKLLLDSMQALSVLLVFQDTAASSMWHQYQALTSALSQQLCEQLRLILEPTQATKLKGDYRTGKRLNMKKVIPYIASQFRKDKIWLRRTKASKREYQICLAVDDSSSMVDNHSKQLAFESLSVIINALTLLEVGQVSVCSFGEKVQLLHPFQQQFNDASGACILRLCQFQQKKTRIAQFLETSTKMFLAARQHSPGSVNSETAQLLLIVSDGRGLFLEGKERVVAAVQEAQSAKIFVIFVVLDNPNSRDSILDIKVPVFKGPAELPEIHSYMDEFPFPFYMILRDVNALPETLSDALRQWFELVTAADQ
uniref:Midasin n=1 Tax=Kryptolebias marmoratus TaxID=37003 RepID=A0A3Q3ARQ7_KRYMA